MLSTHLWNQETELPFFTYYIKRLQQVKNQRGQIKKEDLKRRGKEPVGSRAQLLLQNADFSQRGGSSVDVNLTEKTQTVTDHCLLTQESPAKHTPQTKVQKIQHPWFLTTGNKQLSKDSINACQSVFSVNQLQASSRTARKTHTFNRHTWRSLIYGVDTPLFG